MTQLPIYDFSPLPYAVGSKGFVEHVKSALGALAKGRKAKGSGDSYQLREPSAPYQADSLARPRFEDKVIQHSHQRPPVCSENAMVPNSPRPNKSAIKR